MTGRPPFPPFTEETARQKVQAAENGWNTRDPERVAGAYTEDSVWRNRDTFITGRAAIVEFLTAKWERELDYALRKSLWAFTDDRIAVRFQYESHDAAGQWFRSYGNENWEFDAEGLMRRREASINDRAHPGERAPDLRPSTRVRDRRRLRHPAGLSDMADPPLDVLQRWETAGGHWQVLSRGPAGVVVSLLRCDGGEEVQRLVTSDQPLIDYLGDRDSSSA